MRQDSVFEIAQRISPLYREADRSTKGELLDEFIAATGYHRKAAVRLLHQLREEHPRRPLGRPPLYGAEVAQALRIVWESSDCLCSSRLKPFIGELVKSLRRHGELDVSEDVECCLLTLSRSTIDRLLRPFREKDRRPFNATRPGTLLSDSAPGGKPLDGAATSLGLLTVDSIPHSGGSNERDYLTTLTAQDLATGWSECSVVWTAPQQFGKAVEEIRLHLPFPIHQIRMSDGDEVLCESLYGYCRRRDITFIARSGAAGEEGNSDSQKNWTVVRRLVGFDRYSSQGEEQRLRELYALAKLYMNYFQPHRKLVARVRHEGSVRKTYDEALTPYQRLLEVGGMSCETERRLGAIYERLNPLQLRSEIYAKLRSTEREECLAPPPSS